MIKTTKEDCDRLLMKSWLGSIAQGDRENTKVTKCVDSRKCLMNTWTRRECKQQIEAELDENQMTDYLSEEGRVEWIFWRGDFTLNSDKLDSSWLGRANLNTFAEIIPPNLMWWGWTECSTIRRDEGQSLKFKKKPKVDDQRQPGKPQKERASLGIHPDTGT